MVVSKRCKICTALHPENIPIAGEYFGKVIPILVERICGIVLDDRKINQVLICQHCVIELVYTDVAIEKIRCSVQRLQKPKKSKGQSKEASKIVDSSQAAKGVKKVLNGTVSEEIRSKTNPVSVKKTPETISVGDGVSPDVPKFKKIKNNNSPFVKKTPESKSVGDSVSPDATYETDGPMFKNIKDNDSPPVKKMPEIESIGESVSPNATYEADEPKFKKIKDIESSPVKKTSKKIAKRKPELIEDVLSPDATEDDFDDNNPKKRLKTISSSVTGQSLMDFTTDEQDLDDTNTEEISFHKEAKKKVLNCVICGKSFNKKSALRDHIDACHMGERLKECPHCSMEFRSQQKYESHVFNEKCQNALHICQYPKCNKRFKTVHKMEMHMQDKHSSQNDTGSDN